MHDTVERVVREHQIFAKKKAGERVRVELRQLDHASVQKATISVAEHETARSKAAAPFVPDSSGPELARAHAKRAREEWLRSKEQREASKHQR